MTRAGLVLLTLTLLGGGVAGADDWPGPRVFTVFSPTEPTGSSTRSR